MWEWELKAWIGQADFSFRGVVGPVVCDVASEWSRRQELVDNFLSLGRPVSSCRWFRYVEDGRAWNSWLEGLRRAHVLYMAIECAAHYADCFWSVCSCSLRQCYGRKLLLTV